MALVLTEVPKPLIGIEEHVLVPTVRRSFHLDRSLLEPDDLGLPAAQDAAAPERDRRDDPIEPGVLLQDGERRIVRVENCPAGRARHRQGVAQRTQFDGRPAVLAVESSSLCDGRWLVEGPDVAEGQSVVFDEFPDE